MATSQTWQAELRSLLMGRGTNYPIVDLDVEQDYRSYDLAKLLAPGDFQGPQYAGPIYVSLTLHCKGTSEATLFSNYNALETAWAPSTTDLTFELNLPNYGARTLSGRVAHFDPPRITGEMRAAFHIFGIRAQFKAGTPTWT